MGPSRQPNTDFLTAVTAVAYNILGNHGLAATTRMPCPEMRGVATRYGEVARCKWVGGVRPRLFEIHLTGGTTAEQRLGSTLVPWL